MSSANNQEVKDKNISLEREAELITAIKLHEEINKQLLERCQELEQKIGLLLHPQLRNSRFDFNARYIRFDEAQQIPEFSAITFFLENSKNFSPCEVGDFTFYRRGTGGLWLYVVPTCDFKVPRERKIHTRPKQIQPELSTYDKSILDVNDL